MNKEREVSESIRKDVTWGWVNLPEMTCKRCKQQFKPDNEYDFPEAIIVWHRCPDGQMFQNRIKKEQKKFFSNQKKVLTGKEQWMQRLERFHSPIYHQRKEEDGE